MKNPAQGPTRTAGGKRLAYLGLAIIAGVIVAIMTSPIDPLAFHPDPAPELIGPLAPNRLLRDVERLGEGQLDRPEDVAIDALGRVYGGLEDGTVRRLAAGGGGSPEIFADTGGRPLGLDFDAGGTLWVADSVKGLVSIDPEGRVTVRSTAAAGLPFGLADDVDAAGGKVYFSDASWRHGLGELLRDTLEARPYGRLLEYDPETGDTRVLADDLYFANGVAVSTDGRFVLVAETFRYRIRRVWLSGPDAGRDEVFADNLPGFPDGVSSDGSGTFWVALYTVRNPLLDRVLHPRPWLKRLVAWLPGALSSQVEPYGLVLALDHHGEILRSLHDPGGERVRQVTSVEAAGGHLYLGSLESDAIARLAMVSSPP